MRVAIVGAGSIGSIVGAFINKAGIQADLIDVYQDNIDALNENGVTITGTYDMNVPVKAYHINDLNWKYDYVFVSTKQTVNGKMLEAMLPHLKDDSTVCTLQNGIPEESVAKIVGKERTVGGAVGFGGTWLRPGVSMLTSTEKVMENYAFEIGEIDGKITKRIGKVQEILSSVGKCTVLDNLMGLRWAKVLMNATFSGMSASLGCTFGDVLNDAKAIRCIANIADETIKVVKAQGIKMAIMQGKDFMELELNSQDDIPSKLEFYHSVWDQHALLKASMLQDLEKKKKTEIDYINGIVCSKGREYGILTPFNDKVVELVKRAEDAGTVNSWAAIQEFDKLLSEAQNQKVAG